MYVPFLWHRVGLVGGITDGRGIPVRGKATVWQVLNLRLLQCVHGYPHYFHARRIGS